MSGLLINTNYSGVTSPNVNLSGFVKILFGESVLCFSELKGYGLSGVRIYCHVLKSLM